MYVHAQVVVGAVASSVVTAPSAQAGGPGFGPSGCTGVFPLPAGLVM